MIKQFGNHTVDTKVFEHAKFIVHKDGSLTVTQNSTWRNKMTTRKDVEEALRSIEKGYKCVYFDNVSLYKHEVEAIKQALQEKLDTMWQPIETVLVGENVLVSVEYDGKKETFLGHLPKKDGFICISDGHNTWWLTGMDFIATHWKPLEQMEKSDEE